MRTIRILLYWLVLSLLVISGLFFTAYGYELVTLSGSAFYLIAGVVLIINAVLYFKDKALATCLYMAFLFFTLVWSLYDAGWQFWPQFSRLAFFFLLGLLVVLTSGGAISTKFNLPKALPRFAASVLSLPLLYFAVFAFVPDKLVTADQSYPGHNFASTDTDDGNWPYWSNSQNGTRFSALSQINQENVSSLEVAWTYRTGEIPTPGTGEGFIVTPIAIDGVLYGCTHRSTVFAVEGETGNELWRFESNAKGNNRPRCRGVGYYERDQSDLGDNQQCAARIITTTVDARLIALDAKSGERCDDFGIQGEVNLKAGMGHIKPGFYFPTAAVTLADNLVIVGGLVWDNHEVGEPSGVVRAFSADTGELVWAWDVGRSDIEKLPPADETYSRGTPNVWSKPTYDSEFGQVYLPTGNATPDFWGGHRSAEDEKYGSSVVALDAKTGKEIWHFQTVHHDIWDFDVPSQPALTTVKGDTGEDIPVLLQTTKTGQIFMLDRRNGKPVAAIEEREVPQGGVADDMTAKTQPFSTSLPILGEKTFIESDAWGITPFDQLICRVRFKQLRYEGPFTPPSETETLHYPSWIGGMNWGSVAIDETRNILYVNDIRIATTSKLLPRDVFDAKYSGPSSEGVRGRQLGTPWGIEQGVFNSPLGIPCQAPPFGTLSAIDLQSQKLLWQIPFGTVEDTKLLGAKTHLPVPLGMPSRGAPIVTKGDVMFMAGSQDYYLRAFDPVTGDELWKDRLPVGAETTPMTYAAGGKQYIVIAAGGTDASGEPGDYVIAYSLPDSGK